MAKLTLSDLTNLENQTSAVTTINNNNTSIETALENTLSRDGTSPNSMSADFDMNGHNILNLGAPSASTDPLRLGDITAYISQLDGTSSLLPAAASGDITKVPRVVGVGLLGYSGVAIDGSNNLTPFTDNTGALGTTALKWADLFGASGFVINFNSGDVTITHAANTLTFAGATTGYLFQDGPITPVANDGVALGTSSLGFSDLFLASGAVVNFNAGDVTLTHSANLLTVGGGGVTVTAGDLTLSSGNATLTSGNLTLTSGNATLTSGNLTLSAGRLLPAAGTTTIAPVQMTSGTNLTTAEAGAIEFDGKVFYATPVGANRGVVSTYHKLIVVADQTGQNVATAQNVFGQTSGASTFTAAANTSYFVEAFYIITRAAGATSHTTALSFGGTATYTTGSAIEYVSHTSTGNVLAAISSIYSTNPSTSTVVTAASTSATEHLTLRVRGLFKVATAGTIIPQFTYSAAPGGAPTIVSGTYICVTPIGTDTVAAIGNWS